MDIGMVGPSPRLRASPRLRRTGRRAGSSAAAEQEVRRILRNRARYEVANNSCARGSRETLADDVIGTGPRLQVFLASGDTAEANQAVEREFAGDTAPTIYMLSRCG